MNRFAFLFILFVASLAWGQPSPEPRASITPIAPGKSATLTITVDIPEGYHAQSSQPLSDSLIAFNVTMTSSPGLTIGDIAYPPGQKKTYPDIGQMSVYSGKIEVTIPVDVASDAQLDKLSLDAEVIYQICNEKGTCFAPQTKSVKVLATSANPSAPPKPAAIQQVSLFGYTFDLTSIWVVIPIGALVGLLFNVMPCVLPVLPLKAMGFYEASQHHRTRSLLFGFAFSLGLIAIFVGLAVFVLASKTILGTHFQWGQWFAYAPFVWGMTILLVLLAASMMGAFMVRVPNALYGFNFRHDTMGGNFMWGALTALLSTPCTAPMFAGLVTWSIGQPIWMGVSAMLSVGIGMALPYLVLSAMPGMARNFPRTGPASELVKQAMAFPLLATAAWLAGPRIVGDPQHWWLVLAVAIWGALFVLIRAAQILKSSMGILITTATSVCIVGAVWMVAVRFNGTADKSTVTSTPAADGQWHAYSDQSLAAALQTGQPVIVKFTASWCANCQVIEATVYRDASTLAKLQDKKVILIKADLTRSTAPGWAKLNALGYTGIPLTAVYQKPAESPVLLDSIYTESTLMDILDRR